MLALDVDCLGNVSYMFITGCCAWACKPIKSTKNGIRSRVVIVLTFKLQTVDMRLAARELRPSTSLKTANLKYNDRLPKHLERK